ncbi:MAG: thiamine-phosphate kinase [Thermodesulfobacteriota bacterium]
MAETRTLREVGEHPFLRELCERLRARAAGRRRGGAPPPLVGPGDDCAVLPRLDVPLAVTTDVLVDGVHFRSAWLRPAEIGRRAIAVNLSDLAAMGATPAYTLVSVTAPPELLARDLDALLDAGAAASEEAGALLVGGNLSSASALAVTVTALGTVEGPCLTRAGARPGDHLVVTGTLGGAAAAVAAWSAGREPEPAIRARFAAPEPRVAAGRVLAGAGAHAAIDVSDGLLADLGHLCTASGVGAVVERAALPRLPEVAARDARGEELAATGGEDYELLFACPDATVRRLDELAAAAGVALTVIGRFTEAADGIVLRDADGRTRRPDGIAAGFDHFGRHA